MTHDPSVHLHLRLTVAPGRRAEFFSFLEEAIPFYESPGGIRIRLLQDLNDDHRFIEVVEYADRATYERDQERVRSDTEMHAILARWRSLLAFPPQIETYVGTLDSSA